MPADPEAARPVALLGLMGSGKTTVGRSVARRTGRTLVDVDDVIRNRTGRSVRELWELDGEEGYRHLESSIVIEVLADGGPIVLATPAGAVEDPEVRGAFAAARPFVAWLRARPETLVARVGTSDHRPLLGGRDPLLVLTRQAVDRAGTYASLSDLVIDVDGRDPEAVARRIVEAMGVVPGRPLGEGADPGR